MELLTTFLQAAWATTLDLALWLLVGLAVAALLHALVPAGLVARHLRGTSGVLKAVAIGVPLPLCSCSVIPAGIGLARDGASRGAAVGFLVATPQTGVDSILVAASMLGWPFAILKVVAALITGLVGGLLVERLSPSDEPLAAPAPGAPPTEASRRTLRAAVAHAVDIFRAIWGWLALGVLLSAAITALLPPNALGAFFGQMPALAYVGALAISVPLYVCATGSVPIAASLVAAGFPVGAALVFLMAGPATNVATIGAVRRAFGARTTALYLGTIIAGSLGFAVGAELILGDLLRTHAVHLDHEHGGSGAHPLEVAAAVAFVAALGWFAFEALRQRFGPRRREGGPDRRLTVDGMTCGGCVASVEAALRAVDGIAGVSVDLGAHEARVTFSPSSRAAGLAGGLDTAIAAALTPRGFTVREFGAGEAACADACGVHAHPHAHG
jgi:uncharacterized membrane protein YraQ (UPF0718 family)